MERKVFIEFLTTFFDHSIDSKHENKSYLSKRNRSKCFKTFLLVNMCHHLRAPSDICYVFMSFVLLFLIVAGVQSINNSDYRLKNIFRKGG